MSDSRIENHEQSKAVGKRLRGYAAKFRADTVGRESPRPLPPTDENLRDVLRVCALRPREEWFPVIRRMVEHWPVVESAADPIAALREGGWLG